MYRKICMSVAYSWVNFAAIASSALVSSVVIVNAQDLAPGQTFRDCPDCPEMVVVPAGRVTIGSPRNEPGRSREEGPQTAVTLPGPLAVGKFEVTFAEWDACVADGGCSHRPDDKGWGRGDRPVVNVSWNQVTGQYLPWLSAKTGHSYRLPSEAEWEYAAKAGASTAYWWGTDASDASANCKGCDRRWGGDRTAPVGSFAANPFGLHDLNGNVFEHTADCWNKSHSGAPDDGEARGDGNCKRRVIKGGSWFTPSKWIRSAARMSDPVGYSNSNVGFRVVRSVESDMRLAHATPQDPDRSLLHLTAGTGAEGPCKDGLKWRKVEQGAGQGIARLESCGVQSPTLPIEFSCSTGRSTVTVAVPMVQSLPRMLRGPFPVSLYAQGRGMQTADARDIPDQIRQFQAMRQDGPGKGLLVFEIGEDDPLLQALALGREGYVNIIAETLSFHLDGARDALTAMRSACGLPKLNIAGASDRAAAPTQPGQSATQRVAEGPQEKLLRLLGKDSPQRPRTAEALGCSEPEAELARLVRSVSLRTNGSASKAVPIGTPTTLEWSFSGQLNEACRRPLYLVVTTPKRTRFEGTGFLAIPGGAPGPFGIKHNQEHTRLFFPLHLLDERQGEFKVKSYEVGGLDIEWALVQAKSKVANPKTRDDFALGQEFMSGVVKMDGVARYRAGEPQIVVRDNFTLDKPKRVIRSNSGEFDLQVFDGFYRVLDATTGELLIERTGVDPNFSPGSRFVGAFVHGGSSLHMFSADIPAPNAEITDLYSRVTLTATKPLFLAWGHGDMMLLPGDLPCVRNSCSAALTARQMLVDNSQFDLSVLTETYKSMPDAFQIDISLEAGLVFVKGGRSSSGGWLSIVNPRNSGELEKDGKRPATLLRILSEAGQSAAPILSPTSKSLPWFAQSQSVALSHHCIVAKSGGCDDNLNKRFIYSALRLSHVTVGMPKVYAIAEIDRGASRLATLRSTMDPTINGATDKPEPKGKRIFERLEAALPAFLVSRRVGSQILKYEFDIANDSVAKHIESIKRDISKTSQAAANLLLGQKRAEELAMRTGGGCMVERQDFGGLGRLPSAITHYITQMHAWNSGVHAGWAFRTECTNGASGRNWLWALLATEGQNAELLDLSYAFRASVGHHSAHVSGTEVDPYFEWSWDWPQSVEGIEVSSQRYLLANGAWPKGRWAIVFDLDTRKPITFLPDLENADDFGELALTKDGRTLVQSNTNGQLFFYDTATGKVVLRGVETDDELIIYDDNGYYLSSPDGSQFLNLKFPGIPGYSSVAQFAATLNRPDAIKAILAGRQPLPKPNLTAPPDLRISTTVSGEGGARLATLNFETASEVGLKELIVFVDGRPERRLPLSGDRQQGQVSVDLASEARWISVVTVDRSGYRSIARGQALPGAASPTSSRLFAISVGTDTYSDKRIDALKGAKRDAEQFAGLATLQKGKLYSDVEVIPLFDEPDLKGQLIARIRETVSQARAEDTIMMFAAGHGDRGTDGRFYLLTGDSSLDALEQTSVSWIDIAEAFRGVKARVVIFLDACRSGAAGQSGTNDDVVAEILKEDVPITVIAASKGRQDSLETSEGGYFTRAILKAVHDDRAKTDTNGNGAIELAELYGVLKPSVVYSTGRKQTPWIARNQMVGEIPLF